MILTGPNYSGKSVYMKQVALIVYLAHIGSFVPAESAQIGVSDKILTRVSTRESVSKDSSAFMIDLEQICRTLAHMTSRSLVIIDEFGKGTSVCDGAGLACAVLHHLADLAPEARPKVLAATHFHEIFEAGYLQAPANVLFAHMEVRVDQSAAGVGDEITYLYNLCEGRSNSSFGAVCARANGISRELVERADQLVELMLRGEDIVAACAVVSSDEARELEGAVSIGPITDMTTEHWLTLDLGGRRSSVLGR